MVLDPNTHVARRPLVLIAIAAAIPVIVFTAWVTFINARQERTDARARAAQTLDRVVSRLNDELRIQVEIAEALATSTALDHGNLPWFYEEAMRIKNTRPLWETVALVDLNGQQVVNLLRPMGTPLGTTTDRESFERVIRTRQPAIGGIGTVGKLSGRRLLALRVPVQRDNVVKYVLTVGLVPDAISQILRSAGAPPQWVGAVVDARGNIVARTVDEQFELGQPESQSVRDAISRASSGSYIGRTLEGVEVESIYQSLQGLTGWSVHLGIPTDELNEGFIRSIIFLGASGSASLFLALALAWFSARDIALRRREQEAQAALALKLSEERRSLAIAAADLGVFSWDSQARQLATSTRTRELLGIRSEDEHEQTLSIDTFLSRVVAPDQAQVLDFFFDPDPDSAAAIDFRTYSGQWRRLSGRRAPSDNGGIVMDGVVLDISAAKRMEVDRLHRVRRLSDAQENERRRIARELHDQVGQVVTGLMLGLKNLEQSLRAGRSLSDHETTDKLHWLQKLADQISRDIHQVAADLRPTALDDLGVSRALDALCSDLGARFNIGVDLQVLGAKDRLPPDVEIAVYRIVQEALNNVLKHASATNVSVVLDRRADEYRVIVEDDGIGMSAAKTMPAAGGVTGLGLSGIRERLALLGGTLSIESGQNAGTTLFIVIPLSAREAAE